ncbi:MAG: hypothetical protein JW748_02670 [Anaerolineales bacterium]|nr:hypothetical protein [Anaerolineales bacterium]
MKNRIYCAAINQQSMLTLRPLENRKKGIKMAKNPGENRISKKTKFFRQGMNLAISKIPAE